MPYYQGDYYRGDYYQGDLGGFLKGLAGGAVGAVKGFVTGGAVGALRGALTGSGVVKPPASTPTIRPLGLPTGGLGTTPPMMIAPPNITSMASGLTSGFLPSGGIDVPATTPGAVPTPGTWHGTLSRLLPGGESGFSGAPAGYHINKAYLKYLRASQMGHHATDPFSAPRAKNAVVRNRKMNPLNPRALRKATARIHGMKRMLGRALRGSGFKIARVGLGGKKSGRKR